ncbi:MAG: L-seryl-tRNA(Sec) selenium transferase [Deltaproteobacteria bacterium]|nr:L-seryl-tRNA(Sec) selenium transferase [Deltaproteobacteria bacterium]MCB9786763.1 L-seryl-tRNA(Sec) selenium transferase [Deltaproteobacteria bacterium]
MRTLPGVDTILGSEALSRVGARGEVPREAARAAIEAERERLVAGGEGADARRVAEDAASRAEQMLRPGLRRLINATGVIVHTNLGRAPLMPAAVDAALGACNLEYDLGAGRRGSRRAHVAELLCALSGAEAALVVNNNAAAILLALSALAAGREVIVSRGELVEIGGGFRVPQILETSGARLREVGTTNRTWLADYEAALGPDTAMLLRVHPSNFRMSGFVHTPADQELAALARAHHLPFVHDLGSGTFGPLPPSLEAASSSPARALADGADLVCFSGDKVLGGPQAGILLGSASAIERAARHPLARAVRIDKLALAALEATLLAYRAGHPEQVPVWRMIHAEPEALRARAEALATRLEGLATATIVDCEDAVGAGSHPDQPLPGVALALQSPHHAPDALAERLRRGALPVVAVIARGQLRLHLRTVDPGDDDALAGAVADALSVP